MKRCDTTLTTTGTPGIPNHRPRALPHASLFTLGLATLLAVAPGPAAQAQNLQRQFPPKALRGEMVVVQPPRITMDGKAAQLSPGSRIRNTNNTIVLSASLVGKELNVNYVLDSHGSVHEVWILNASEAAKKMPGMGTERNYSFAPDQPAARNADN
ncbi:hypothetical protein [Hydrogenophaga sp.]|uniref:hypothetical protein n=1 Tax=Hydrogenophaga sp. TaxID=1904254 RepID=UPI003566310C